MGNHPLLERTCHNASAAGGLGKGLTRANINTVVFIKLAISAQTGLTTVKKGRVDRIVSVTIPVPVL